MRPRLPHLRSDAMRRSGWTHNKACEVLSLRIHCSSSPHSPAMDLPETFRVTSPLRSHGNRCGPCAPRCGRLLHSLPSCVPRSLLPKLGSQLVAGAGPSSRAMKSIGGAGITTTSFRIFRNQQLFRETYCAKPSFLGTLSNCLHQASY